MTDMTAAATAVPAGMTRAQKNYFTAWRWHFYAGLYVMPFLAMLAVTGLIMLWVSATTDLNGERTAVAITGPALAPSVLAEAAVAAVPGTVTQYISPRAEGRVALFIVAGEGGDTAVTVNPYDGTVVDSFPAYEGLYSLASDIHGSLLLGQTGDLMIEAAASLGLIMIASGLYLHWPRGGRRGMLRPDLGLRGRSLWKTLHGTVGTWVSLMLAIFLISGLSWALVWGDRMVQAWSTFPAEKWDNVPLSDETHASMNHGAANEVPWVLEQTPLPESGSLAGTAAIRAGGVTLDSVAAFADRIGFNGRYQVAIPGDGAGVWTISHDSMSNDGPDPWGDRTIHIDQYTGNVLADVQFADYSVYGKMMAVGIAFHEGDMGNWNLALNTLFCLSVIFMSVSGAVMWWKRRPEKAGRLAAPPRAQPAWRWIGAVVVVAALGLAFPMGGLAILAVVLIDQTVLRLLPGVKRALS
jgi:uncharacterized iron-regulated membrane protein